MKFFISTILIAALSFAACLFLPWWVIAIAGFVVAFAIPQKNGLAFLSGFIALFILWAGMSIYMSNANGNLLVHKMSMLFLKADNPTALFLLTGFIGGLVAGLGSLSGRLLKKMVVKS
jgi:hypothetical protein